MSGSEQEHRHGNPAGSHSDDSRQRLVDSEHRHRLLLDNISDLVIATDGDLAPVFINGAASDLLGWQPADLLRQGSGMWAALGLDRLLAEIGPDWQALRLAPAIHAARLACTDGGSVAVEIKCSVMSDAGGQVSGLMLVCRDTGLRQQMDRELRLAAKVFENSLEGIYITDAQGVISQVNPAFTTITGYAREEAQGRRPNFLTSGQNQGAFLRAIQPMLERDGHWQGELLNRRREGELFPCWVSISEVRGPRGGLLGHITSFRDISESKNSEERIRHLAYYDSLTGLPNRSLFMDRLQHELARAQRHGYSVALLFIDLDGFKAINDTLGHLAGDLLLKRVAARLQGCMRAEDTVARMGGDEFTIILGRLADHESAGVVAAGIAGKILKALEAGVDIPGGEVFVSPSIGVALYPGHGGDAGELLKHADVAMYHAKDAGKNNFQFYTDVMSTSSRERLRLQNELHHAVREDQFELAYQPIVHLADGSLAAVEALLRWRHPRLGLLSAGKFLPMAEEAGLMPAIGEKVLRLACSHFAGWRRRGLGATSIVVNMARRQLMDTALPERIALALREAGLPAQYLELDLVETALILDVGTSAPLLQALADQGVRMAVDNFGRGASSLLHLRELPLHSLKIDVSFVAGLPDGEADCRIVEAIVGLGHSFSLSVTAEGVERPAQAEFLHRLGVSRAQGFLFGEPLNAEAFAARWCP